MKYYRSRRILRLLLVITATGFLVAGVAVWRAVTVSTGEATAAVMVNIPEGTSARGIGGILAGHGLVRNTWAWNLYLRFFDRRGELKAGLYAVEPGLTIPQIAVLLTDGKSKSQDKVLLIREGETVEEIATTLETLGYDATGFRVLATTPDAELRGAHADILGALPEGASLEGYLFPDTYFLAPDATPRQIADRLLAAFGRKFDADLRAAIAAQNQSIHSVVIMASVVEGEAREDEDRPVVAGVFYNRLREGMPLQSDATLDYLMGEAKVKHTIEDTQIDSPYNTYKYPGLPAGPIGNPGLASLTAAAKPADTPYFYFLNNATTGATVYAVTFEEHVRNKEANGL